MAKEFNEGIRQDEFNPSEGAAYGNDGDDFGNIFEDAADVATSAWDDTVGKVIPDFMKEGVRKFADSAIGHVVLMAVSGSIYGALAPTLGAQASAIVFALPGMARGDSFVQAWTEGFIERLTILIKYFVGQGIPDDKAAEQVTNAAQADMQKVQDYANKVGVDNVAKMTIQQLASMLGIRQDMAAEWLSNATGDLNLPKQYSFDPKTGAIVGKVSNWKEKARMVAAAVDVRQGRTVLEKARAMANIQAILAQNKASTNAAQVKRAAATAGGAGLGIGGALLLGVSGPWIIGAGIAVGALGYLLGKTPTQAEVTAAQRQQLAAIDMARKALGAKRK